MPIVAHGGNVPPGDYRALGTRRNLNPSGRGHVLARQQDRHNGWRKITDLLGVIDVAVRRRC
jgi:hypothetical protein